MTLTPDVTDALKGRIGELRSRCGLVRRSRDRDADRRRYCARQPARGHSCIGLSRRFHDADRRRLEIAQLLWRQELGAASSAWLLSGLLYANRRGIVAFNNPLLASPAVLTPLLAASLVASGVVRAWIGYKHWAKNGAGWIITALILTILCGIVIAIGWPHQQPVGARHVPGDRPDLLQGWTAIALSSCTLKSGK